MHGMRCRISVEALENGFEVEVPDMEAMKKKMAEKRKEKGMEAYYPYPGDFTKKYAAKNVKEVIKLVNNALNGLPEMDFDAAFKEASAKA